jgi:hypothetical protein
MAMGGGGGGGGGETPQILCEVKVQQVWFSNYANFYVNF